MRRRRSTAACIGLAMVIVLPVSASAYSLDTYNGHYTPEAPENVACVSASALTHISYINNGTDYSHATAMSWYNEVRTGDHNFYQYQNWNEDGLDPRGWAWLLWEKSPAAYGFNDYRYVTKSQADTNIMAGIRATGEPVGAIVFAGLHAVDVVGFQATADPLEQPSTLQGFWIVDPYYGAPNVKHHPSGFTGWIGLAPNSYLTISTWDSGYLKLYTDAKYSAAHSGAVTMWDNRYVVVLRAVDGSPQPSNSVAGPTPGATATFASTYTGSLASAVAGGVARATTPALPLSQLDKAVLDGIVDNDLSSDPHMGISLQNPGTGRHVHVDSLVADFPSYELVEVTNAGTVVAIAMATDHPDGVRFAGLQALFDGNRIRTTQDVSTAFNSQGVGARSLRLVWGWSNETMAPFTPIWEATDNSGRHEYMAPDGTVISSFQIATR